MTTSNSYRPGTMPGMVKGATVIITDPRDARAGQTATVKAVYKSRATLVFGDGEVISYPFSAMKVQKGG